MRAIRNGKAGTGWWGSAFEPPDLFWRMLLPRGSLFYFRKKFPNPSLVNRRRHHRRFLMAVAINRQKDPRIARFLVDDLSQHKGNDRILRAMNDQDWGIHSLKLPPRVKLIQHEKRQT